MLVSMIGVASAATVIQGTIYVNGDISNFVPDATVDVTCGMGDSTGETISTTSSSTGKYSVTFTNSEVCNIESWANVYAEKAGVGTGYATGQIHNLNTNLNLAIVDVPLVPEFGAVVGVLTVLGAVGMFLVVRKK